MSEQQNYTVSPEVATPRWVGLVVAILAAVSLIALGTAWTASSRSKSLEQSLQSQVQIDKQATDLLNQRLAKDEETNAQVQGELSVVTDKVKLTEGELKRARAQASKIKDADAKELADLQNSVSGQLATKASVDDVNKLGTDVSGVKTDLETTKGNLQMARDQFGNLIAKNHDEIEDLRRMGERDYYEFTIDKKGSRQKVGDLMVELRGTNPKKNLYSVALYVDDQRFEKKNRSAMEPIYFLTRTARTPYELVVNQVTKDKVAGYLSVPKAAAPRQTAGSK
ncbi:MAG: hypothetical protein WBC04_13335 [Candidatus Acidiferrales bacterium]